MRMGVNHFSFQLEQNHARARARAGVITTPHGQIQTPIFMPVGTAATVKSLDSLDIAATQAQIILANTYHLFLRPGTDLLEKAGGVHQFMQWPKPMLTDSGGFQVFSLGKQIEGRVKATHDRAGESQKRGQALSKVTITDEGVSFSSHLDGSKHLFTPERAIDIQRSIGADIIMAFDECAPDKASKEYIEKSMHRTHAWAERCQSQWQQSGKLSVYGSYQALFGIIQGGMFQDLRQASARYITGTDSDLNFDGIAVGGETIGYNMAGTVQVMDWIESLLPSDKPRYAMGLGRDPQDLLDAVAAGFDMFDCVGPTRLARNGALYQGHLEKQGDWLKFSSPSAKGRLSIASAQYAADQEVIQPGCDCYTCQQGYTRAYLHHLYKSKELSYYRLATLHNVRFMIRLSEDIRKFILTGELE